MNLKLLNNYLLIEPLKDEEKGGVVIPEIAASKKWHCNTGILHAFGDDVHRVHPDLKCGCHVIFKPYGDFEDIALRGKRFMVIDVEHVLGIIE